MIFMEPKGLTKPLVEIFLWILGIGSFLWMSAHLRQPRTYFRIGYYHITDLHWNLPPNVISSNSKIRWSPVPIEDAQGEQRAVLNQLVEPHLRQPRTYCRIIERRHFPPFPYGVYDACKDVLGAHWKDVYGRNRWCGCRPSRGDIRNGVDSHKLTDKVWPNKVADLVGDPRNRFLASGRLFVTGCLLIHLLHESPVTIVIVRVKRRVVCL